MSKYRFKTKEEFIRDGLWDEKYNCPDKWALDGEMNKYLGKDVPNEFNVQCDDNEKVKYDSYGVIGETSLFDKEKSHFETIDVGFKFFA